MKTVRLPLAAGVALLFAATSHAATPPPKSPLPTAAGIARAAKGRLPALLACLREQKVPLIGAHRGGPIPEYPENALSTFQRTTAMIPVFLEIDIQQTFDDKLFLNHDPVLERNTTGFGAIGDRMWADVAKLKLRDQTGQPGDQSPILLADALKWADGHALLLLDTKPATDPEMIIAAVRDAGAEDRVMYLAYTLKQFQKMRAAAPDAVIALPLFSRAALDAAKAAGVLDGKLLAMARPGQVDDAFIADVEKLGATVMSGSYGGSTMPDAVYRSIADAGSYQALAAKGPRLIVSNRPFEAAAAMLAQPNYSAKLARCEITG